jgi:histone H3/H4
LNLATGKESYTSTAFTEANWGKTTRSYLTSINALSDRKLQDIIDKAKEYAKATARSTVPTLDLDTEDIDERAQLVDGGDSDSDGRSG